MIATARRIISGSRDEDRARVTQHEGFTTIVVADGAGGVGGGRVAAETLCARVGGVRPSAALDWSEVLGSSDNYLARHGTGGLTTGVVVEVAARSIRGSSVGDSGAWLLHDGRLEDLTMAQHRKPLIGTGAAVPVTFGPVPFQGRLLVASDGLFKYASRQVLMTAMNLGTIEEAVDRLVDAVRLPNRGLQDDVAVVLAESTG